MSNITMRLDAGALSALINSDPQFKFELQRAVVSEITRRVLFKDMGDALSVVTPQLKAELISSLRDDAELRGRLDTALQDAMSQMKADATNWGRGTRQLRPELAQLMKAEVSAIIATARHEATVDFEKRLKEQLAEREREFLDRAERVVEQNINDKVVKAIDEGVSRRIEAIKAGL